MTRPKKQKTRDSEQTRRALIEAVGRLLAREGFQALGVNSIAREAGVDKVLIYRYFGGLPGLIAAFGREGDFWPSLQELTGGDSETFMRLPLAERLSLVARNYLKALKKRALTQAVMAWEMTERNDLTAELETIRENNTLQLFNLLASDGMEHKDIQALSALIGAGISYLVLRSAKIKSYGGIDLQSEHGWERLEKAIDMIIKGIS